jgi:hypothetical protein
MTGTVVGELEEGGLGEVVGRLLVPGELVVCVTVTGTYTTEGAVAVPPPSVKVV